jgi:hypothetical protein
MTSTAIAALVRLVFSAIGAASGYRTYAAAFIFLVVQTLVNAHFLPGLELGWLLTFLIAAVPATLRDSIAKLAGQLGEALKLLRSLQPNGPDFGVLAGKLHAVPEEFRQTAPPIDGGGIEDAAYWNAVRGTQQPAGPIGDVGLPGERGPRDAKEAAAWDRRPLVAQPPQPTPHPDRSAPMPPFPGEIHRTVPTGFPVLLFALTLSSASVASAQELWTLSASLPGERSLQLRETVADGVTVQVSQRGQIYLRWNVPVLAGNVPAPGPNPQPPTPPGPTPPPTPPGPNPTPPPAPGPLPAGEFGVSALVRDAALKVQSATRSAEATKAADAAEAIAAQIAAGALTDAQTLLNDVGVALQQLGPPWKPFSRELSTILAAAYTKHSSGRLRITAGGGIVEPDGWATLCREVAAGLRAAAQ